MVIKSHQYRHFIHLAHVGVFQQIYKIFSHSLAEFFLLICEFIQFFQIIQILFKRILIRMCDRHLIHIIIHISKQIHSGWLFAKQFFDSEILVSDLFFDCQLFLVHFCKQINQSHIKINEAFIWIICLICRIICFFSCFIFPYQQIPDSSRFFIIADKVQNIEIFFSLISAQSPSKLLQKDNRRFCRTQEHYHIN